MQANSTHIRRSWSQVLSIAFQWSWALEEKLEVDVFLAVDCKRDRESKHRRRGWVPWSLLPDLYCLSNFSRERFWVHVEDFGAVSVDY